MPPGCERLPAQVTTTDLLLARNNPRNFLNPATIDFGYDFNRDRSVNTTDVLLARNNQTNFLTDLNLISVPLAEGGEAESLIFASLGEDATGAVAATDALAARLAWFQVYEQSHRKERSSGRQSPAAGAVDLLLAAGWL